MRMINFCLVVTLVILGVFAYQINAQEMSWQAERPSAKVTASGALVAIAVPRVISARIRFASARASERETIG